jgi:hypothetical protein
VGSASLLLLVSGTEDSFEAALAGFALLGTGQYEQNSLLGFGAM